MKKLVKSGLVSAAVAGAMLAASPAVAQETGSNVAPAYDAQKAANGFSLWFLNEFTDTLESYALEDRLFNNNGVTVLDFHATSKNRYQSVRGSIDETCDADPDGGDGAFSFLSFSLPLLLTPEERAARCYWTLRYHHVPDAVETVQRLMDENYDTASALAFLKQQGIAPGSEASLSVEWSDYFDAGRELKERVLETRLYSGRNCPAIENVLGRLETFEIGRIDIDGFGAPAPEPAKASSDQPFYDIELMSQHEGQHMELRFIGRIGMAKRLYDEVEYIMSVCEPEAS